MIKCDRNKVTLEGIKLLFKKILLHLVEHNFTAELLYNMDKTGFSQKQKSEKVVALQGSGNVWTKSVDTNFYITYVLYVYETGAVMPPLLIIPGHRLNQNLVDGYDTPGYVATCVPNVL